MTDFADAFNRGQQAAADAARARAEVEAVFGMARQELLEATEGRIDLSIVNFDKPRKKTMADFVGVAAGLDSFFNQVRPETEPWLAARNPTAADANWIKLAKWERPHEGYPCLLSYDKQDVRCHDKVALAEAIAGLLASAFAGERLHELLERATKPAEGEPSS